MWVSILVFLIINFISLGLLCYCFISICLDDKTKTARKCNVLKHENEDLKSSLQRTRIALDKHKRRYPYTSKLEIGQICSCVVNDRVKCGNIAGITFLQDGVVQYMVKQLNGKEFKVIEEQILAEDCFGRCKCEGKNIVKH